MLPKGTQLVPSGLLTTAQPKATICQAPVPVRRHPYHLSLWRSQSQDQQGKQVVPTGRS